MTDPILRRVGERVRARRTRLGLTARELAERAGLSARFVSQLENGRANIAIGRLDAVARVLGVDPAELVASEEWLAWSGRDAPAPDAKASLPLVGRARPVALLGLRGAGKSTIGRLLADLLRWPLVEVDARIEQAAGLDLGRIFTVHGESYYRRLEALVVGELLGTGEPMVLAPSGGVVTNGPVFSLLRARCVTVWLRATPDEHMDRVLGQGDDRPMADRAQPMAELQAMLAARAPLYAQADLVLDTSGEAPEDAAEELLAAVEALHEEQRRLGTG